MVKGRRLRADADSVVRLEGFYVAVGCWTKEPRPEPFTTLTMGYISGAICIAIWLAIRTQPTQRWRRHSWSIIGIWFSLMDDAVTPCLFLPLYFYTNAEVFAWNYFCTSLSLSSLKKKKQQLHSLISVSVNLPKGPCRLSSMQCNPTTSSFGQRRNRPAKEREDVFS